MAHAPKNRARRGVGSIAVHRRRLFDDRFPWESHVIHNIDLTTKSAAREGSPSRIFRRLAETTGS